MPLSMDEATKRYEGYIQNIQDSIFTIESCMAEQMTFQKKHTAIHCKFAAT